MIKLTWPELVLQLRPVDVKRQEHIYEVIITESNHCQVLQVIQKVTDIKICLLTFLGCFTNSLCFLTFPQIFVEGMYKYLNLSKEVVDRIFPCIDKMIDIHMSFLEELRIRQNEQPVVTTIADILCRQFSSEYYSHLLFVLIYHEEHVDQKPHCLIVVSSPSSFLVKNSKIRIKESWRSWYDC